REGSSFRRDAQTALSPATSINSSGGTPSRSKVRYRRLQSCVMTSGPTDPLGWRLA
ncbi:hypothetical protein D4764_15G0008600, partial [Takifugu flavidus]